MLKNMSDQNMFAIDSMYKSFPRESQEDRIPTFDKIMNELN